MAAIGVQLSVNIKDLNGDSTPQQVYFTIDDAKTIANMNTAIGTYLGALDTVIDGVIDSVQAKVNVPFTGLKDTFGPNSIGTGALFTYLLNVTDGNRSYGQQTPTWAQAKIVNGQVNESDAAVQTYYRFWTSGPITNLSAFLSNNWVSLLTTKRVKLNIRKHRREQQRLNEEPLAP